MNYAHTIGHAVEALSNYAIPHGVGIALGMLVENAIALQKGMLSKTAFQRIAVLAHALVPETAWKILALFRSAVDNLVVP